MIVPRPRVCSLDSLSLLDSDVEEGGDQAEEADDQRHGGGRPHV